MNVALQRTSGLFPWVFAGVLILLPGEVQAAPRGSAAWCEQMMDKPAGSWSINDHNAFDDRCKEQRAEMTKRVNNYITEDDDEVERNMEGKGKHSPASRKRVAPPPPAAPQSQADGSNSAVPADQTTIDPGAEAHRIARHYLDTHKGDGDSASPARLPAAPSGDTPQQNP